MMTQAEIDAEQALMAKQRAMNPLDVIDPRVPRADPTVRHKRMETCKACPSFHYGTCSECGCVMKLKTWLAMSTCPIGKW